MPSHMGTVSRMLSGRLRQLDRRLHIDDSEESEWVWAIPVVGFAVTVAILIVAGVMSGVWAAEYIPTALVVGLVISGLFVACMLPEDIPPEHDQGNRGPDTEPSATPPRVPPPGWVGPARRLGGEPGPRGRGAEERPPRGAGRRVALASERRPL